MLAEAEAHNPTTVAAVAKRAVRRAEGTEAMAAQAAAITLPPHDIMAMALAGLHEDVARPYVTPWARVASIITSAWKALEVSGEVFRQLGEEDDEQVDEIDGEIWDIFQGAWAQIVTLNAPDWAGVAIKARVLTNHYGSVCPEAGWLKVAQELIEVCEDLGDQPVEDLEDIKVLKAAGLSERMAYLLATEPDGYRDFAFGRDVSKLAALVESILGDSRYLGAATPRQMMLRGAVMDAVWFGQMPVGCEEAGAAQEAEMATC